MSESAVQVEVLRKVLQRFNEKYGEVIADTNRNRLGKILTIIDASLQDPEQRKAVKDIIQNEWYGYNGAYPPDFDVHIEIRKVTEALGFKLYLESELAMPVNTLNNEFNRYEDLVN